MNSKHYVARERLKHLILVSERIEQALLERLGVDRLDELLGLPVRDSSGSLEPNEDERLTALLGLLADDSAIAVMPDDYRWKKYCRGLFELPIAA